MKKEKFNKVTQVKKISRTALGPVPPTKVVPVGLDRENKKSKKHPKKAIQQEIDGE